MSWHPFVDDLLSHVSYLDNGARLTDAHLHSLELRLRDVVASTPNVLAELATLSQRLDENKLFAMRDQVIELIRAGLKIAKAHGLDSKHLATARRLAEASARSALDEESGAKKPKARRRTTKRA